MKNLKDNLRQAGFALLVAGTLIGAPNAVTYLAVKKNIESQPSNKTKLEAAYNASNTITNSGFFEKFFFAGGYIAAKQACRKYEGRLDNDSN